MEFQDYQAIVSNTGKALLFINTILFFIGFSRQGKAYKVFTYYLLAMSIIQGIAYYFWSQGINNLFLSHYYFIIQFFMLSIFYMLLYKEERQKWIVWGVSGVITIILFVLYCNQPELYYKFNQSEIILTSVAIITYSVIHFYNSLSEQLKFNYVNSGIFIYILSSSLIFCSGNIMPELDASINRIVWFFNVIIYLVMQVLITIEWLRNFKKSS